MSLSNRRALPIGLAIAVAVLAPIAATASGDGARDPVPMPAQASRRSRRLLGRRGVAQRREQPRGAMVLGTAHPTEPPLGSQFTPRASGFDEEPLR